MKIIRARFSDYVYLAARLSAVFRIVQSAVDAIFLNCVLGNLQTSLRLLRLLLNTAGVDAVNLKVIVVSRAAGKANGALIAATVVLSKGGEKRETSPVAPVVGKICDLIRVNHRGRFCGTAVRRTGGCLDLDFFRNRADFKPNVQRVRLADLQSDSFNHPGLEASIRNRHGVASDGHAGEAVVAVRIGPLILSDIRVHRQDLHTGSPDSGSH